MAVAMTDTQGFDITVIALNRKGRVVAWDNPVLFSSSNVAILTVTSTGVDSAQVVGAGAIGDAQVFIDGVAGGVPLTGSVDVSVSAAPATQIGINTGSVFEQP